MSTFDYVVYSRKSDNSLTELHRGTVQNAIDVFVEKKDVTPSSATITSYPTTIEHSKPFSMSGPFVPGAAGIKDISLLIHATATQKYASAVRDDATKTWVINNIKFDRAGDKLMRIVTEDNAGNKSEVSVTIKATDPVTTTPPPGAELPPSNGPVLHAVSLADVRTKDSSALVGQHIELPPGSYNNTSALTLQRAILKAPTIGSVTISGAPIHLAGAGTCVWGIRLKPNALMRFSGSKASLRRCYIDLSTSLSYAFDIESPDVLFDHCEIFGKAGANPSFLLQERVALRMRVTKSHIHDMGGSGEIMQLGHSSMSDWNNQAEIAYNRMEKLNIGDSELITYKSQGANTHHNTVIQSPAAFCFRQAPRQRFEDNILIGVGLTVHGHSHIVRHNQIIDVPNSQSRQALSMFTGNIKEYPSGANAYYGEVRDCNVEENIFVKTISGGGIPVHLGSSYSGNLYPPINNRFNRNIMYGTAGGALTGTSGSASWNNNITSANLVYATGTASRGNMPAALTSDPLITRDANGVYQFTDNSPLKWTQDLVYLRPQDVGPMAP